MPFAKDQRYVVKDCGLQIYTRVEFALHPNESYYRYYAYYAYYMACYFASECISLVLQPCYLFIKINPLIELKGINSIRCNMRNMRNIGNMKVKIKLVSEVKKTNNGSPHFV